jgi:hypothetical protein
MFCKTTVNIVLMLGLLSFEQAIAAPFNPQPLSASEQKLFMGSPEDPPTKKLLGVSKKYEGRHYINGDEYYLHKWRSAIQGLGGAYVGVGADQSYVLIGWQRPSLVWQIDYDAFVPLIHKIYRAFFTSEATPEEFWNLWTSKGLSRGVQVLEKALGNDPQKALVIKMYRRYQKRILFRFRLLRQRLRRGKTAWFMTDQSQYDVIRTLIRTGRIRSMSTNLLASVGLRNIGKTAKTLGVPIRVLYLSNAEQYWPYNDVFKANMAALPFDEKSLLLRTISTWNINKDYSYFSQPALTFLSFLNAPWVKKVRDLLPRPWPRSARPRDVVYMAVTWDVATARAQKKKKRSRKRRR